MAIELVTGTGATDHIGSEDDGARVAYTYGTGSYILAGCDAKAVDANTIRIEDGELLVEGRHVRVKGSEDVKIQSGSSGYNRADLIALKYSKDIDGIEDAYLTAIPGTPVEGQPQDPAHIKGSILAGDVAAEIPLYRVKISSLSVSDPELIVERSDTLKIIEKAIWDCLSQKATKTELTTGLAGKAAASHTHTAANITNLKAWIRDTFWPVGRYWISHSSTSPASLIGGTWTQITGRVLRAANDTNTGGADTVTLTAAQMPRHQHATGLSNQGGGRTDWGLSASGAHGGKVLLYIGAGGSSVTDWTGSSSAHSNVPAYQDVYTWRRTA